MNEVREMTHFFGVDLALKEDTYIVVVNDSEIVDHRQVAHHEHVIPMLAELSEAYPVKVVYSDDRYLVDEMLARGVHAELLHITQRSKYRLMAEAAHHLENYNIKLPEPYLLAAGMALFRRTIFRFE